MPEKAGVVAGLILLVTVMLVPERAAWSQGSGSARTNPPRETRPPTPEEFQQSFWRYIVRAESPYNKWKELSAAESERGILSPHAGKARVYVNKTAAENEAALPHGSVLVREDFDDKGKRVSISVMYRVKGTAPEHNDWYWLKYLENGTTARTPAKEGGKPISGKVASCIECHSKAAGKDWVFSNDQSKKTGEAKVEK